MTLSIGKWVDHKTDFDHEVPLYNAQLTFIQITRALTNTRTYRFARIPKRTLGLKSRVVEVHKTPVGIDRVASCPFCPDPSVQSLHLDDAVSEVCKWKLLLMPSSRHCLRHFSLSKVSPQVFFKFHHLWTSFELQFYYSSLLLQPPSSPSTPCTGWSPKRCNSYLAVAKENPPKLYFGSCLTLKNSGLNSNCLSLEQA